MQIRPALGWLKANGTAFPERACLVVIFGLRRGGSTMVSDAMAACKGALVYE